jgi:hypothetical protein
MEVNMKNERIKIEKINKNYVIYIDNIKINEEYLKENYLKISNKKDALNVAKYELKLIKEREKINITEYNNELKKMRGKCNIKINKENFKKSIYSDVDLISFYTIDKKRFILAVLYKNGKKTIELKEKYAHNLRIKEIEVIEWN